MGGRAILARNTLLNVRIQLFCTVLRHCSNYSENMTKSICAWEHVRFRSANPPTHNYHIVLIRCAVPYSAWRNAGMNWNHTGCIIR
jgi:hypothetical protein